MLNNEVCRRCFLKRYAEDRHLDVLMTHLHRSWDEGGKVLCWRSRAGQMMYFVSRYEVPDVCLYVTEHVVSQDAE